MTILLIVATLQTTVFKIVAMCLAARSGYELRMPGLIFKPRH